MARTLAMSDIERWPGFDSITSSRSRLIHKIRDGCILVEAASVAMNPTDWKSIERRAVPGVTLGCDYASIVQNSKPGDQVRGFVHNYAVQMEDGAFVEYISPKLTYPTSTTQTDEVTPIFIYSGSTATGTLATQFAKLSGYKAITTHSRHNVVLAKRLGTDEDCKYRGDYSALFPATIECENVKRRFKVAYTAFRKRFQFGGRAFFPAPLGAHPPRVCLGGLSGVSEGLGLMKEGKVSREKLAYNAAGTL
ncbi:uncharacterized protein EURHEDRAFT_513718 [Aspergillus ruber CBS 135680]|uniref:Uncharacterized protein n=1 Tax=Aspergillus ruber (strain CBS 135680) TaxID=1388766 RepID=A0A017SJK5_ASPRC|nr:uncharacterized protein EURHEDRAFT_513718 [Aspergillus ruber CBS 135680]EYE97123.1 hypothetical protein EURHEDRAFT_513718 [Aspergillus ruber CBS 135680]